MTSIQPTQMTGPATNAEAAMSLLEHLDELRSRLLKATIGFLIAFGVCWAFSDRVLEFLVRPIRRHMFDGDAIVFINITEPFMIYMKASALLAVFVAAPLILYQFWAFVAPGLHKHEAGLVVPFLFFGSLFFLGGGAFGYYVATPVAARWLINLGGDFQASITLRSAFQFESIIILGMGAVFELPIVIFFLSRTGLVTPAFMMRHFRYAVLGIAVLSAVLTPTGDVVTMSVFAGPMILLYLLGVAVSWVSQKRRERKKRADAGTQDGP
jgi:sec-independent protein translocase protein TatC